jgi:hypothetical protein
MYDDVLQNLTKDAKKHNVMLENQSILMLGKIGQLEIREDN